MRYFAVNETNAPQTFSALLISRVEITVSPECSLVRVVNSESYFVAEWFSILFMQRKTAGSIPVTRD